jgi:hypothetical protein
MGAAVRFKHTSVPRQQGEQARLKVVQGPDFGAVYVITGTRATLGRGEENDIMVSDLKASRRHAEFSQVPGGWNVRDLGSANGLLHNGRVTREATIKSGDSVTFGETTLEFMTGDAGTSLLVAPPRTAAELGAANKAFEAQRGKVRAMGGMQGAAAQGRKNLLYLAVAAAAGFLFFMPDEAPKAPVSKKPRDFQATEDLRKYLPGAKAEPVTAKMVEQFFRTGFREYTAGNYLRAKNQFETVLQMSPGHPLATLYLQNCDKDIKAEVEYHLKRGKRALDAGKLKDAKGHYEAVQRILYRDQANPAFTESKEQLELTLKQMEGEGS